VDTIADGPVQEGNRGCGEPGGHVDERRLRIAENHGL